MSFRVIQISDTHLTDRVGHFAGNAEALARHIAAARPDLVVNTGDVSMNGAGDTADLDTAARWHERLGVEVRAVPGNHDVGDLAAIRPDQPIDDARLAAFRARFDADFWHVDIDGWRLIGLDAMLFGSGHAEEERQFARLEEITETTARLALFLHKPLFIDHVDEGPRGHWTVRPEPRRRLLDIFEGADLRLVASGHLHGARLRTVDDLHHVWAPAGSFVCGPMQEDLGGDRFVGVVEHVFAHDGVTSRLVRPDGVANIVIDPINDEVYPPHAADAAQA